MKKIISTLLTFVLLFSCISSLSACIDSNAKNYDTLTTFIIENGIEESGKFSITRKLSELGESWKDSTTVITITYEQNSGNICMEEITVDKDNATYAKAVSTKNDEKVYVTHTYGNNEYYGKGYILKTSFSYANSETSVYGFETNNAPFGQANAKASLGVASYLLFSHTMFLLRNVKCPVSLNDIGFNAL